MMAPSRAVRRLVWISKQCIGFLGLVCSVDVGFLLRCSWQAISHFLEELLRAVVVDVEGNLIRDGKELWIVLLDELHENIGSHLVLVQVDDAFCDGEVFGRGGVVEEIED